MVVHMSTYSELLDDLYAAIAEGASGDRLRAFFHPDAEQVEYPSLMRPGRPPPIGGRDARRGGARPGA